MATKTVKTPFLRSLRQALGLALEAEKSGLPVDQFLELELEKRRLARRRFLKNAGTALAVGSLSTEFLFCKNEPSKTGQKPTDKTAPAPRIAIIGGGMAGLNTLHHLRKAGHEATVYESSGRLGGRIFTVKEAMGEGTWTEFGGEFIDTNHADMWTLANEFDLELIDSDQPSEQKLKAEAYFFEGKLRPLREVVKEFLRFAPKMKADIDRLPDEINWQTTDPFTKELDALNLSDYLTRIGAKGWPKRLIEVAFEAEYGLAPTEQSSLNLLLLISPEVTGGKIEWFGESDERYKTRGGNQQIPDSIAAKHADRIQLNTALEAIKPAANGGFLLNFNGKQAAVEADFVVLALPFTRLRQLDLAPLNLPANKLKCIRELGYGTNAKLMIGMKNHFWRKKGFTGLVYADNGVPNGWDNAQLQTPDDGPAGLSILFGGVPGMNVGDGTPESQATVFLEKWEQIFPGAKANFNGKFARMHWPSYPHNLGSYVCPRPCQYTTIGGLEQEPVGHLFFAGEHCGGDFAGFMNGAAKSGREAAEAILAAIH